MAAKTNIKDYSLDRNSDESKRLDLQHKAFVSSAGYVLHPRISSWLSTRKEPPHIADVATGTGAWILDLQAQTQKAASPSSPPWSFTGLDISPAQFPESSTCTFATLNMLEPIPAQYKEAFDVVHMQMLMGALTTPDWTFVAKNLFDLVKPGGWIQWHELAAATIKAFPLHVTASTAAANKLVDIGIGGMQKFGRFMPEDMPLFKERVESAHFQHVEVHVPSCDREPESRGINSQIMVEAQRAITSHLARNDPNAGVTEQELAELFEAAKLELQENAYYRWDGYIITGQKPA